MEGFLEWYNYSMKAIHNFLFGLTLTLTALFLAPVAFAQTQDFAQINPMCVGNPNYGAGDVATIQGIECLGANVLAVVVTILGIIAFVMFLVGGFKILTGAGNSKSIESGRNAITFAIGGIVVALASILILRFIATLTGVDILHFGTQVNPPQVQQGSPA
jgi:hypothetical protein